MSPLARFLCLIVVSIVCVVNSFAQEVEKVEFCKLKGDPAAYNHKLIEVTGFISHGFEDFGMFAPQCPAYPYVWLEYGGKIKSGTMYCCGVTRDRSRGKPLVVETIPVSLKDDDLFKRFDSLVQHPPSSLLYATVIGRFFAGEKIKWIKDKDVWGGYGHMGCCSLLAIESVTYVGPHDDSTLDYALMSDPIGATEADYKNHCRFYELGDTSFEAQLKAQKKAEADQSFPDSKVAAHDSLPNILQKDEEWMKTEPKVVKQSASVAVLEWSPQPKLRYRVTMSRPYTLSIYASDPKKVAWVATSAYKTVCP